MLDELAAAVRAAGRAPAHPQRQPDVRRRLRASPTSRRRWRCSSSSRRSALQPTVFYMSSSGKGQAGLELARKLLAAASAVHGVTATGEFHVPSRTAAIANETRPRSASTCASRPDDVVNFGGFVGAGYGVPSEAGTEAVRLFARTRASILDPIYTGKAAAAMIAHAARGPLRPGRRGRLRPHRRRRRRSSPGATFGLERRVTAPRRPAPEPSPMRRTPWTADSSSPLCRRRARRHARHPARALAQARPARSPSARARAC